MEKDILNVTGLTLSFGGLVALNEVTIRVKAGTICALIGPNGAGKTTVFNCISRFYSPDRGDILFRNQSILKTPPHKIAASGIGRTFQNIELFEEMTVLDNILVGYHLLVKPSLFRSIVFNKKFIRDEIKIRGLAEEIIDLLDLEPYRETIVGNIPYGVKKRVELARALATRPKLILLDEPAAGLNKEETEDLYWWILDIKEELDITVLIIEHDMGFVMKLAESVAVLDYGQVIVQGTPEEVQVHPGVIDAYMGKDEQSAEVK